VQAIEGNPLSPAKVATFDRFEREGRPQDLRPKPESSTKKERSASFSGCKRIHTKKPLVSRVSAARLSPFSAGLRARMAR